MRPRIPAGAGGVKKALADASPERPRDFPRLSNTMS